MKLFFSGLVFMLTVEFFSKFVQWWLVATFKFSINHMTELLSLAISGFILFVAFILFSFRSRETNNLKLLYLLFSLLAMFFGKLVKYVFVSGFDFPNTLAIDFSSFALSGIIFTMLFALLGQKLDVFK